MDVFIFVAKKAKYDVERREVAKANGDFYAFFFVDFVLSLQSNSHFLTFTILHTIISHHLSFQQDVFF